MDFSVFSGREIQNFIALTQVAEAEGVTDVRFLRERLHNHLAAQFKKLRPSRAERAEAQRFRALPPCPECGAPLVPTRHEGLHIIACRKCRWSKVVQNNQNMTQARGDIE